MMRPPNDRYPTPEEFDDSRFGDSYWFTAIMLLVALVLGGSYALTGWCGWTGQEAAPVVGAGVVAWIVAAVVVYVVWARARRNRRRGGRG